MDSSQALSSTKVTRSSSSSPVNNNSNSLEGNVLYQNIEKIKSKIMDTDTLLALHTHTQDKLKNANDKIESLNKQISVQESVFSQNKRLEKENCELKNQNSKLEKTINHLQNVIASKEEEIKQQADRFSKTMSTLHENHQEEKKKYLIENNELKKQINIDLSEKTKITNTRKKNELLELKKEINILKKQNSEMKKIKKENEDNKLKFKQTLWEAHSKIQEQNDTISQLSQPQPPSINEKLQQHIAFISNQLTITQNSGNKIYDDIFKLFEIIYQHRSIVDQIQIKNDFLFKTLLSCQEYIDQLQTDKNQMSLEIQKYQNKNFNNTDHLSEISKFQNEISTLKSLQDNYISIISKQNSLLLSSPLSNSSRISTNQTLDYSLSSVNHSLFKDKNMPSSPILHLSPISHQDNISSNKLPLISSEISKNSASSSSHDHIISSYIPHSQQDNIESSIASTSISTSKNEPSSISKNFSAAGLCDLFNLFKSRQMDEAIENLTAWLDNPSISISILFQKCLLLSYSPQIYSFLSMIYSSSTSYQREKLSDRLLNCSRDTFFLVEPHETLIAFHCSLCKINGELERSRIFLYDIIRWSESINLKWFAIFLEIYPQVFQRESFFCTAFSIFISHLIFNLSKTSPIYQQQYLYYQRLASTLQKNNLSEISSKKFLSKEVNILIKKIFVLSSSSQLSHLSNIHHEYIRSLEILSLIDWHFTFNYIMAQCLYPLLDSLKDDLMISKVINVIGIVAGVGLRFVSNPSHSLSHIDSNKQMSYIVSHHLISIRQKISTFLLIKDKHVIQIEVIKVLLELSKGLLENIVPYGVFTWYKNFKNKHLIPPELNNMILVLQCTFSKLG